MDIKKVMVVDDSEADQFLTQSIIEKYDDTIEIFQAYDGIEALDMLIEKKMKPDIIFLDINMPRMNGLEFLEEYAKHTSQQNVVTMLTSSDQENDKKISMSYDFVMNYFIKLLNQEDLERLHKMRA